MRQLDEKVRRDNCISIGNRISRSGFSLSNSKLQPAFPSLTFMQPVAMVQAPHSNDRWYVAEKPGRLVSFANTALATTQTTFIDLSAQVDDRVEGGLLGVAFHPDYATNGYVFLSYTTSDVPSDPTSANFRSVISRPLGVRMVILASSPSAETSIAHVSVDSV